MFDKTITISNPILILFLIFLLIMGSVSVVRGIINSGIIYFLFNDLKTAIYKIPIFKSKKLRFEIGMIIGWITNKNKLRKRVKNFYTWGRIGKITSNHKSYKRVPYLAAFSMGKPIRSDLKRVNCYRRSKSN